MIAIQSDACVVPTFVEEAKQRRLVQVAPPWAEPAFRTSQVDRNHSPELGQVQRSVEPRRGTSARRPPVASSDMVVLSALMGRPSRQAESSTTTDRSASLADQAR